MDKQSLEALEQRGEFARRHIGPSEEEKAAMLALLGVPGLGELVDRALPPSIRRSEPLALPEPRSEAQALSDLRELASQNRVLRSFIGLGYYNCRMPSVILRNLLENPGWYTAYTPYQPEISQGRLEALINFQTMVADLTGMEIANASLLDEPTAAAEAMALTLRVAKSKSRRFFVSSDCHPRTVAVVKTRARPIGLEVIVGDPERDLAGLDVFGALLQYPASTGEIRDLREVVQNARARGVVVAVASDLLALCMLVPPGEFGADVVVGSAQRFGVPPGYGGPHAGFLATREEFKRAMPGRLVGITVDAAGAPCYRLALQTREQHIRREKATSNICTAEVLLAVIAGMYAVYHGPEGLAAIARRVHRHTSVLAQGLRKLGWEVPAEYFFDTITVDSGPGTPALLAAARGRGINLREVDARTIGIALDETATRADIAELWRIFGADRAARITLEALGPEAGEKLPESLVRTSAFLTHPVFHAHRSETRMTRYLRALAGRDIALDRSMIALGSCTMKLSAASAMLPVSWREFSEIHPFAPPEQAKGYARLTADLEAWLAEITGYDAVSLQPNAGSQGEFSGLLAIRAYHESRGEGDRHVCLIPASAHGTNPASATMAGLKVVVVACDENGDVSVADLDKKTREHSRELAAIMVTYPSTHGVFEASIREICDSVHRA